VRGSEEEFEQLFRAHHDAVYGFVARRVPGEAVQDVVSETFLTAWRRRADIKGDPLPWLLGVARRTAANGRRGDERRSALRSQLQAEHPPEASLPFVPADMALMAALRSLSERDREALMLIAWDDLEHRDAARVMGCSVAAFSVRLHRARGRLRRALGESLHTGEGHHTVNTNNETRQAQ
jgi:RNA polymerase sigma factor (sigma-70 family)